MCCTVFFSVKFCKLGCKYIQSLFEQKLSWDDDDFTKLGLPSSAKISCAELFNIFLHFISGRGEGWEVGRWDRKLRAHLSNNDILPRKKIVKMNLLVFSNRSNGNLLTSCVSFRRKNKVYLKNIQRLSVVFCWKILRHSIFCCIARTVSFRSLLEKWFLVKLIIFCSNVFHLNFLIILK